MKLHSRRALVTICVLVCLLVASSLVISSLRGTILHRRDIQLREQHLQAEWLLDAGIQIANQRIRTTSPYQGEEWRPQEMPFPFPSAVAVIRSIDETSWRITACVGASDLPDIPRSGVIRAEYVLKLPKTSLQTTESLQ